MPRFFIDAALALEQTLELPEPIRRHALGVLRLREGSAITLFNGRGGEYRGRLVEATPRCARVVLDAFEAREAEPDYCVTVAQGLSGGDKMDWTVEKSVELGASAIQPLSLERSVLRLEGERAQRRRAHWQAIANAAAEQCGRNRIPHVHAVARLEGWLEVLPTESLRICANPKAQVAITTTPRPVAGCPVYLLIGPEGGFGNAELERIASAGFHPVSLGPRVLRTETAALAALAMLSAAWATPDPQ